MLAVGPLGPQYCLLFAWHELGESGVGWGNKSQLVHTFLIFFVPGGGGPDEQVPGGDAVQGDGAP